MDKIIEALSAFFQSAAKLVSASNSDLGVIALAMLILATVAIIFFWNAKAQIIKLVVFVLLCLFLFFGIGFGVIWKNQISGDQQVTNDQNVVSEEERQLQDKLGKIIDRINKE